MNLDKIYKDNKGALRTEIRKALEEKYRGKTLFLAGNGIILTYPSGLPRVIDNFCTLSLSKRELSTILSGSEVTVKSSMSHKVDTLIWSTNSWYNRDHFAEYEYRQVSWDEFLQPIVDLMYNKYIKSGLL